MSTITVLRAGSPVVTIEIDEKTKLSHALMGEHKIVCEYVSGVIVPLAIGDYISFNDENFYINRLPEIKKINNTTFHYKITFEGVEYDLKKKLFISSDRLAEYAYVGTAFDVVTNIVENMNETMSGWSVGTVDETEERLMAFSNESCWAALMKVAEEFGLEFSIATKSISLQASAGASSPLTFEYGRGNGLYTIERQQVSDQNIITRLYAYGGMTNIPYGYRDRAKRLVFASKYLDKNTGLYGIIEGQFTDDNIYPRRTGTLTAVNMEFDEDDNFDPRESYIEDSSIDFDLNDYLIAGVTPQIVFKSGDLSGNEFDIWKYDHTNHRIYFNPYSDGDGYTLPNVLNTPEVGDTYTLVNIAMPQSYIDDAEDELEDAAQDFLDENCIPMVVYDVEIDQKFAAENEVILTPGDRVTVIDDSLGINTEIRVSEVEFPLVNRYAIKATIADFVPYTLTERVVKNLAVLKKETTIVDRTQSELARRNTLRQKQLRSLIFDPDGYFDPVNIKPLSIETMYLSVGARSMDFRLNGVTIKPNYLGDANRLYVGTGTLIHFQLDVSGNYTWTIGSALDQGSLTPATAYYLYAKCSKTVMTGTWDLSATQKEADPGDGYYYFLCGILYAVYADWRDFDFMYGMTYINGRIITTGKIQTVDGQNYIDLDENEFRIGDYYSYLDWNVTTGSTLTIHGALVQSGGGTTFPIPCFRGAYGSGTTYYRGDIVTYEDSTWMYINASSGSGHTPEEGSYWTCYAAGGSGTPGSTGPSIVYRGEFSASSTYYNNSLRRDIVKYGSLYYIFNGTDATSGAWNPSNWESFGANFESIATGLLFAELAFIENLGVREFEGAPRSYGDLDGSFSTVQANQTATARIDRVELTGSSGSAVIGCNGFYGLAEYTLDLIQAAEDFVNEYESNFAAVGIVLSSNLQYVYFTAATPGTDFTESAYINNVSGDLDGYATTQQANVVAQARIDECTMSGTGGCAVITVDELTRDIEFDTSLNNTVVIFVADNYVDWYSLGVTIEAVTGASAKVRFTAQTPGTDFTGTSSIDNNPWVGSVKIKNNEIWENAADSDTYGAIKINDRGYQGGYTKYRATLFGNGKGTTLMGILGADAGGMVKGLNLVAGMPIALAPMSTTQINALTAQEGTLAYDITTHALKIRTNSGWETVSSS